MAARTGFMRQLPRLPRRRLGYAARAVRSALKLGRRTVLAAIELPLMLSGSDRGVTARVRRRMRSLGLDDTSIIVESWRGEVTLRGALALEQANRLASELMKVRGVKYVNNFLRR